MRVSAERRVRNRNVAKGLKLQHKAFEAALKTNDAGKVKENTSTSMKLIDQAAAKGVIHKNNASRRTSRLAQALNKAAA
jgi:small subunit ribosomal protein S20